MAVTIKLPTQLRAAAGGASTVALEGDTVGAVLEALYAEHPELRDSLSDADGGLRRFVNVYVDGEDVRFGDGLQTTVKDGGEVQILPAVAGGCAPGAAGAPRRAPILGPRGPGAGDPQDVAGAGTAALARRWRR